jgi:predicted DNA-binding protein (MmcQ/YjbR family)
MQLHDLTAHFDTYLQTTYGIQWGEHVVAKVAGKVFCIVSLTELGYDAISVKVDKAIFPELMLRPGFGQAPHLARSMWVTIDVSKITWQEQKVFLGQSYKLVVAGMSKIKQAQLLEQSNLESK